MKLISRTTLTALVFVTAGSARADIIPSPVTDLASQANGGVAFSSSVGFGGTPDRVNDGNRDGNYGDNTVAHSSGEANAFMGVNLPSSKQLGSVIIFNRTGFEGRLDGGGTVPFEVQLFNAGSQVFDGLYTYSPDISITGSGGDSATGMTIAVGSVLADKVLLIQHNSDYMNIAEIEAYAPAVPEPTSLTLFVLGALGLFAAARRRQGSSPL